MLNYLNELNSAIQLDIWKIVVILSTGFLQPLYDYIKYEFNPNGGR